MNISGISNYIQFFNIVMSPLFVEERDFQDAFDKYFLNLQWKGLCFKPIEPSLYVHLIFL